MYMAVPPGGTLFSEEQFARNVYSLCSGHVKLTTTLTHEELASMLGTARESITRVISGMKRKQMIAIQGAWMTILRKDALELLV